VHPLTVAVLTSVVVTSSVLAAPASSGSVTNTARTASIVARNITGKYFEIMQAPPDSRYVFTKFICARQKKL